MNGSAHRSRLAGRRRYTMAARQMHQALQPPLLESLHWDFNSWVHLLFIAVTGGTCWLVGWPGLLAYPALQLFADLLYYGFGIRIFDPTVTIQRGYQVSLFYNDTPHSEGIDYGFNYYNGDYTKSRRQAQIDKFDHAYRALELEPGMRLIDIGCGCGDWLDYLGGRGVEAVGVNITDDQVKVCRARGLTVHWTDWKRILVDEELQEKLYGRFDRVTFWDTVEHYVPAQFRRDVARIDAIYRDMFRLARNLLRDERGKVFISCLHIKRSVSAEGLSWKALRKGWYCYILDKFHSGNYPSARRDDLVRNAAGLFALERREDLTLDYFMTSKLEPTHFGRHRFRWNAARVLYALWTAISDPFWLQRFVWFASAAWMDQFDEDDPSKSDMVLWWLTLRAEPAAAADATAST